MAAELDLLLRGLNAQEREALLGLGETVPFAEGEIVLPAGRTEWDTYIVQEGAVSIWVGTVCLADLASGQTLGTAAVLFPHLQWSAVRGKRRGCLLRIPREALLDFFETLPQDKFQQFCLNIFKLWVEVLKQRNERVAKIQRRILHASRPPRRTGRFKLLVVDDEPDIVRIVTEFFRDRYDVATAANGLQALEVALAEKPDLVLLDLHMPELDGFSVCQRLKAHPQTGHIPIVMVSALKAVPDKVKGMMYGADEYLTKPVDLQKLDDTTRRILDRVYSSS
jgi:CheY-like chemotaxis protein